MCCCLRPVKGTFHSAWRPSGRGAPRPYFDGAGFVGPDLLLILALALALGGEILGRYLFFVSAVPTHLAAPYLPLQSEAA